MTTINRPFERLVKGKTATLDDIEPSKTALVIIDMQNWDSHPDYGLARVVKQQNIECEGYWDRVEEQVVPNNARLLDAFRAIQAKIAYTVPASYFTDYSDGGLNSRGLWRAADALVGTDACEIRRELTPRLGEAVIVKTGSGAWSTSSIDHVLRHAGITKLFITGVVTNGCVMTSALGAADYGYDVHIVTDATASFTPYHEQIGMEVFSMYNFGLWKTDEVVQALLAKHSNLTSRCASNTV